MSKKKRRFKSNQDPAILEIMRPFQELGVVVEAVRFPLEAEVDAHEFSRTKARDGIKVLTKRLKGRMRKYGIKKGAISKPFQIHIIEGRQPEGRKVDFQEFLGKGFELEPEALSLFEAPLNGEVPLHLRGLVWALLNPPMRLQSPNVIAHQTYGEGAKENEWMVDLLRRFANDVLGTSSFQATEHLQIFSWSTDWSTYFQAGHEWWGAYCYTILDPQNGWLTMLAASTTD